MAIDSPDSEDRKIDPNTILVEGEKINTQVFLFDESWFENQSNPSATAHVTRSAMDGLLRRS